MIPFEQYIGEYVVLVTKSVADPDEISGIRTNLSKLFRFKKKWVVARQLLRDDVRDEDFLCWLDSVWGREELNLKSFIKHRKEV